MKRIALISSLLLVLVTTAFSQAPGDEVFIFDGRGIEGYPQWDSTVVVCGGCDTATVLVVPINTDTFTDARMIVHLPPGLEYCGWVGSSSGTVTEIDVFSDPANPVFGVPDLTSTSAFAFSIALQADCRVIDDINMANPILIEWDLSWYDDDAGRREGKKFTPFNNYNSGIKVPVLNIVSVTPSYPTVTLNDSVTKTICVQQNGISAFLDSFVLTDDYDESNFEIRSVKICGVEKDFEDDGDILTISVRGADFLCTSITSGAADEVFSEDEEICIEITYRAIGCASNSFVRSTYSATWLCNFQDCPVESNTDAFNVIANTFDQALTHNVITDVGLCAPSVREVCLINNTTELVSGTGMFIDPFIQIQKSCSDSAFFGVTEFRIGSNVIPVTPVPGKGVRALFADLFTTDPDGPGGLDDLDGDTYFDDLAAGDTLCLEYDFSLTSSSFENCAAGVGCGLNELWVSGGYSTICGVNRKSDSSIYNLPFYDGNATFSLPANLGLNESAVAEICTDATSTGFDLACSGTGSFKVVLTSGGDAITVDSVWYDSTLIPTSAWTASGDSVIINFGDPSILSELCFHVWFTHNSCGGTITNTWNAEVIMICDDAPCYVEMSRGCATRFAIDRPCPSCDMIATGEFNVVRTTYGCDPADRTTVLNENSPGVNTSVATNGDSLRFEVFGRLLDDSITIPHVNLFWNDQNYSSRPMPTWTTNPEYTYAPLMLDTAWLEYYDTTSMTWTRYDCVTSVWNHDWSAEYNPFAGGTPAGYRLIIDTACWNALPRNQGDSVVIRGNMHVNHLQQFNRRNTTRCTRTAGVLSGLQADWTSLNEGSGQYGLCNRTAESLDLHTSTVSVREFRCPSYCGGRFQRNFFRGVRQSNSGFNCFENMADVFPNEYRGVGEMEFVRISWAYDPDEFSNSTYPDIDTSLIEFYWNGTWRSNVNPDSISFNLLSGDTIGVVAWYFHDGALADFNTNYNPDWGSPAGTAAFFAYRYDYGSSRTCNLGVFGEPVFNSSYLIDSRSYLDKFLPDSLRQTGLSFIRPGAQFQFWSAANLSGCSNLPNPYPNNYTSITPDAALKEIETSVAFFDVDVCNLVSRTLPDHWLGLKILGGNFDLDSVVQLSTGKKIEMVDISLNEFTYPGARVFASGADTLGPLPSAGCETYRVYLNLIGCDLDSIEWFTGHKCEGGTGPSQLSIFQFTLSGTTYRSSNARWYKDQTDVTSGFNSSCVYGGWSKSILETLVADLQIAVLDEPSGAQQLCDTIEYAWEVKNVKLGAIDSIHSCIYLPLIGGMDFIPGTVEYRYPNTGGGTWQSTGDFVATGRPNPNGIEYCTFVDTIISSIGSFGLPGIRAGGDSNKVAFRAKFITTCDFQESVLDIVRYGATGKSICPDPISAPIVNSDPFGILDPFPAQTNNYITFFEPDATFGCADTQTLRLIVFNQGPSPTDTIETLRVIFPSTLRVVPGSISPVSPVDWLLDCPVTIDSVGVIGSGGYQRATLCLPDSSPVLNAMILEFDVVIPDTAACEKHLIFAQTSIEQELFCDSEPDDTCAIDIKTNTGEEAIIEVNTAVGLGLEANISNSCNSYSNRPNWSPDQWALVGEVPLINQGLQDLDIGDTLFVKYWGDASCNGVLDTSSTTPITLRDELFQVDTIVLASTLPAGDTLFHVIDTVLFGNEFACCGFMIELINGLGCDCNNSFQNYDLDIQYYDTTGIGNRFSVCVDQSINSLELELYDLPSGQAYWFDALCDYSEYSCYDVSYSVIAGAAQDYEYFYPEYIEFYDFGSGWNFAVYEIVFTHFKDGCNSRDAACGVSDTFYFTFVPSDLPLLLSSDPDTICGPANCGQVVVQFVDAMGDTIDVPGGVLGGISDVSWSPTTGVSDTTILDPEICPGTSQWYFVNYSFVNESSGDTCSGRDSVFMNVGPLDAGVEISVPDFTICAGDSLTNVDYRNYVNPFDPAISYFTLPDSFIINRNDISQPDFAPNMQVTYQVMATWPNGCVATDSFTIFLTDTTATVNVNDTTQCRSIDSIYSVEVCSDADQPYSIWIYIDDVLVDSVMGNTDSCSTAMFKLDGADGTYEYKVFVKSDTLCELRGWDSATLTILPYAIVDWDGSDSICNGGAASLSISTTATIDSIYVVDGDFGASISCQDCINPSISPDTTSLVVVRVVNANGCLGFDTTRIAVGYCPDTIYDTLYHHGDTLEICIPQVNLTAGVDSVYLCYEPGPGNVEIIAINDTCVLYISDSSFVGNDTFCFVAIDSNGVEDTTIVIVTIYPPPDTIYDTVVYHGDSIDICVPQFVLVGPADTATATFCNGDSPDQGMIQILGSDDSCLWIRYFSDSSYVGNDTLCLVVEDSFGNVDTTHVIITIVGPPDTLYDTLQPLDTIIICLTGDDLTTGLDSVIVCDSGMMGTIFPYLSSDSCWYYVADSNFVGDTICLLGIDSNGIHDTTIWILDPLYPPDTMYDTVAPGDTIVICVSADDLGDVDSISVCDSGSMGTLVQISDSCYWYIADTSFIGDTVCLVAYDSTGTPDTTIWIIDPLYPPDTMYDTLAPGDTIVICVSADDLGDVDSISVCDSGSMGTLVQISDSCYWYIADTSFNGDTVCLVAYDSTGTPDTTIWIIDPLYPPDTMYDTLAPGDTIVICVSADDLGDVDSISVCDSGSMGTLVQISDSCYWYIADTSFIGDTVCLVAYDSTGTPDTTIWIIDPLYPPDTMYDTLAPGDTIVICVSADDLGDVDSISVCDSGSMGTLVQISDSCYWYIADTSFNGDTVCLVAYDSTGTPDTTIWIIDPLYPPDTMYDTLAPGDTIVICVSADDLGDVDSISVCDSGSMGTLVQISDSCYWYIADTSFNGDTVCLVAYDSTGTPDTTIWIIDPLYPPDTMYDTLAPGDTIVICVSADDLGDVDSISVCDSGSMGTLVQISDSCYWYIADTSFNGDTVCLVAYDSTGTPDTTIWILTPFLCDLVKDTLILGCDESGMDVDHKVCLSIDPLTVDAYDIFVGGAPYLGFVGVCTPDTTRSYDLSLGVGLVGCTSLQLTSDWMKGSSSLISAPVTYSSIAALVADMAAADPTGGWSWDGVQFITTTDYTSVYSSLEIFSGCAFTSNEIFINTVISYAGTTVDVPEDTCVWVTVIDTVDGCTTDSIYVCSYCITPDTIWTTVPPGGSDTTCLDMSELGSGPYSIYTCDSSGLTYLGDSFTVVDDTCIVFTAPTTGWDGDTLCIVICDSLGFCDTTWIIYLADCDSNLIAEDSIYVLNCAGDSMVNVCLSVDPLAASAYDIFVDGMPYLGFIGGCSPDTMRAYDLSISTGIIGCTTLQLTADWEKDMTALLTAPINYTSVAALVADMAAADPSGGWTWDGVQFISTTNYASSYSVLEIFSSCNFTSNIIDINTTITFKSTEMQVPGDSCHWIVVVDSATNCVDSVKVIVITDADSCQDIVAVDDYASTTYNAEVIIDILANDQVPCDTTGDTIMTISIITDAANGSTTLNTDNTVTYTPDIGFCGLDSFQYVVCCDTLCDTAWVWVDVNCDGLVAVDDSATTEQDMPIDINILGNDNIPCDTMGDTTLTVSIIDSTDNGSITLNSDNTVTYVPNDGYCGPDAFQYVVCCDSVCDTAWAYIDVACEGDSIVIYQLVTGNNPWIIDLPPGVSCDDITVQIYNRWGNIVHKDENYLNDWRGTWQKTGESLPDGTYYYIVRFGASCEGEYYIKQSKDGDAEMINIKGASVAGFITIHR